MNKIVISHPLYHVGMEMLEGKAELIVPNNGDSDQIIDVLRDADAFILRIGKIDRKAIEQCPNLKVITRPGVGYDNVDVEAATERGIPVVLCPAANARAVAEHCAAKGYGPGRIREEYFVGLPHPRDINNRDLAQLSARITQDLKGAMA